MFMDPFLSECAAYSPPTAGETFRGRESTRLHRETTRFHRETTRLHAMRAPFPPASPDRTVARARSSGHPADPVGHVRWHRTTVAYVLCRTTTHKNRPDDNGPHGNSGPPGRSGPP
ncbi:hypothetical protein GCM10010357_41560 [Streptomyces luteireticuli]|uniref:Uncharacterized protein n=1 Tax=Streptomyces luteireticuli TaxID=173858 RepID=A0ABP3IQH7_9ACTN